jgi:hypothetical protein
MSDVWDSAASATVGPKWYFGKVFTDAFYVYISKGEPKVPFDPDQHSKDKRFTQIKIDGQCQRADGTTYEISREIIAEFGREWAGIVLPSLKVAGACGNGPHLDGQDKRRRAQVDHVQISGILP